MAVNLALEYKGFLQFLSRARHKFNKWFGPHCNHDPIRIAFLAAREWDGMADLERKPFIRSQAKLETSSNPYIRYLLHNRYGGEDCSVNSSDECQEQTFNPRLAKSHSQKWRSLSEEQKLQFSTLRTHDQGIEYVIEKRNALHDCYEPKKLSALEFILRTKPRWPASSRMWFYRHECHSLSSKIAQEKWQNLTDDERGVYERCALIDSKRYEFEKNAWITRILAIDLDSDHFTLSDFDISEVKNRFDSLGSIVDISRELPSLVNLRRPRNPFSLFIEAYRYQIRDERPEFQFGRHLKECSEAWSKLSDEERNIYKEQSRRLIERRKQLLANEPRADTRLTIPIDLFYASKSIHGPCKPAHLYPKLPSAMTLWSEENGIRNNSRLKMWKELPEDVQNIYIERRERLKQTIERQKREIDRRHKSVKLLVREAAKLEDLKQKLHLIGSSKKAVKNLYT